MTDIDYDAIVIGAGPAGRHCAALLVAGALQVLLVARGMGARARTVHRGIPSAVPVPGMALPSVPAGIVIRRGTGRLDGPGAVDVDGRRYRTRHVVLATGSEAAVPPIPGLADLPGVWTDPGSIGPLAAPRRLLVLGDDTVGVECAQAARRLDSEVVLIVGSGRILPQAPKAISVAVDEVLRNEGVEVIVGSRVTAVRSDGGDFVVTTDDRWERRGERLFVAAERRPRIAGLGLESVGIVADEAGIPVDSGLRAAENVWAVGDVTGVRRLPDVGRHQAEIVAAAILGRPREADYRALPDLVRTDPPAVSVGLIDDRFGVTVPLPAMAGPGGRGRTGSTVPGFVTLLSDGRHLTGAHAVGAQAVEWAQQTTTAIRARVPLTVLNEVVRPSPGFSEVLAQAVGELRAQAASAAGAGSTRAGDG